MFPQGFLGTRGDLLMDIVILALVAVVPIVLYNWRLARTGRYPLHKTMQISLAALLAVVVGLFEVNLRLQGGIFKATEASSFAGTGTLNF
jgi:high-affinity Fe2+/Pb2+ permease